MIVVDRSRCCYCGGCVSLCPVDAILLQETHLRIGENCTQCGLCLPACPMGALSVRQEPATAEPLRRSYDLVIVGAGPAGSTAARDAARRGLSVLLLEKRQEIGSPVRCAEGIAHDPLTAFIEPDPRWIAAPVTQERVIVVQGGQEREALFADDGVRLWVDDRLFVDQWQDQTAPYSADVSLTQGYHRVRLEYYERGGAAAMRLNWAASR